MVREGDGSRRLCRTLRSSWTIAISHERRAVSGRQLGQCGKFLHLHNVSPTPTTYLASTNPDICVALSHFILLHLLHTKVVKLTVTCGNSLVEQFWWKHSGRKRAVCLQQGGPESSLLPQEQLISSYPRECQAK